MEELVSMSETASSKFWCGKRVLLTGHSGFKGEKFLTMIPKLRDK
jgi:hypothetical protein